MKILILSGGCPPSEDLIVREADWADFIIAVDHGYDMAAAQGIAVDILLGDMDSIESSEPNLPMERFSPQKDETDTELALLYAQKKSPQEIHILGGVGSRIDHSLGNLFLLEKFADCNISIKDDTNEIRLIQVGSYALEREQFSYVSLIPLTDEICFSTEGLHYEVKNLTIPRSSPQAISNELIGESGKIILHSGKAFLIQSKDGQ